MLSYANATTYRDPEAAAKINAAIRPLAEQVQKLVAEKRYTAKRQAEQMRIQAQIDGLRAELPEVVLVESAALLFLWENSVAAIADHDRIQAEWLRRMTDSDMLDIVGSAERMVGNAAVRRLWVRLQGHMKHLAETQPLTVALWLEGWTEVTAMAAELAQGDLRSMPQHSLGSVAAWLAAKSVLDAQSYTEWGHFGRVLQRLNDLPRA